MLLYATPFTLLYLRYSTYTTLRTLIYTCTLHHVTLHFATLVLL